MCRAHGALGKGCVNLAVVRHGGNVVRGNGCSIAAIMRPHEADHPLAVGNGVGGCAVRIVNRDAVIHIGADMVQQGIHTCAYFVASSVLRKIHVGHDCCVSVHGACVCGLMAHRHSNDCA